VSESLAVLVLVGLMVGGVFVGNALGYLGFSVLFDDFGNPRWW